MLLLLMLTGNFYLMKNRDHKNRTATLVSSDLEYPVSKGVPLQCSISTMTIVERFRLVTVNDRLFRVKQHGSCGKIFSSHTSGCTYPSYYPTPVISDIAVDCPVKFRQ